MTAVNKGKIVTISIDHGVKIHLFLGLSHTFWGCAVCRAAERPRSQRPVPGYVTFPWTRAQSRCVSKGRADHSSGLPADTEVVSILSLSF